MNRTFLDDVQRELSLVDSVHAPFGSLHEACAALGKTMDELFDEVRKKRRKRNFQSIHEHLVCVAVAAVMAARTLDNTKP